MRKNIKLGVGVLTVLATPIIVNIIDGNEVQAEYRGQVFYHLNKPANWWYSDGEDWYFFQNGKKHNGYGIDANGKRYFVDGKYANGIYGGKLYKNGIESKGRTYVNGIFYDGNIRPANGWYDDGNNCISSKMAKNIQGKP